MQTRQINSIAKDSLKIKKIKKHAKIRRIERLNPKHSNEQPFKKGLHKTKKNQLKQFDFFFYRSCFRIMNEFYKEKFKHFYNFTCKKQGTASASTSKQEVDGLLEKFLLSIFGNDVFDHGPKCEEHEKKQMINSMLMIVFSHRHCKNDLFITETLESGTHVSDFSIMRDVMYKYSKKA